MPDDTLILLNNGAEESIFTLEEFQRGIEVFQKQQATWSRWPASGTFDMVKFGERQCLLNLINTWWLSRKAPTEPFLARAVPTYKKEDGQRCKLQTYFFIK